MDWESLAQTVIRGKAPSPFAILWVEKDGQVMYMNEHAMHNKKAETDYGILPVVTEKGADGRKVNKYVGFHIGQIHPEADRAAAVAEWTKERPEGAGMWTFKTKAIVKKTGEAQPVEVRLITIYCNGKSIGNFAGIKPDDGKPWESFDAETLTASSILEAFEPPAILDEGLICGMAVVGDRFKRNEVYVPEVLISARAMKAGMAFIEPMIVRSGMQPIGKVVMGTVKGDLHDIGKNLVCMMLQGAGFEIFDLGVDTGHDKFLKAAQDTGAKIVGCSALLTTTMPQMSRVVKTFQENAALGVKVMIGGAPVTQAYADEIHANGYAPDAASAVELAKKLYGVGVES
ncbi:MAG: corrinoid protein [Planctomycetes bacterium]|nr:corrinoid protein [Planctomycetota bacterium]